MRPLLGWYQIAGGIAGLVVVTVLHVRDGASLDAFAVLVALPFVAVIIAGVLLLRDHPVGFGLSVLMQSAQILSVAFGSASYHFGAGLHLGEWFSDRGLRFRAGLDLAFTVGWDDPQPVTVIGVNAVPILMLAALWHLSRKRELARSAEEVPSGAV